MSSRVFIAEIIWIMLAFIISVILVGIVNITIPACVSYIMQNTFFGLNLFLEILVFSALNAFVVFGIKGFFESYSHRFANTIVFSTGMILVTVIFILAYQVLF